MTLFCRLRLGLRDSEPLQALHFLFFTISLLSEPTFSFKRALFGLFFELYRGGLSLAPPPAAPGLSVIDLALSSSEAYRPHGPGPSCGPQTTTTAVWTAHRALQSLMGSNNVTETKLCNV